MQTIKISTKEKILLAIILLTALAMRLYNITFQSFWLDEIHTAIESEMKFSELMAFLDCCDIHPPLFYLTEKFIFAIFGNNELTARLPTAIASTTSIWAIFLLGKELYSIRIGLIAAALTCFNYFHIEYAQDARPYAFVFLFVCFSFFYFVRFLRQLDIKNALLFSIFSLLTLYFHYFGLFILVAQIFIAFIFWINEAQYKKKFFVNFLISGLVILLGFSIQLKHVFSMSEIKNMWISKPSDDFIKTLFNQFFGDSNLIVPIAILFLFCGLIFLFSNRNNMEKGLVNDPFAFSSMVLLLWIIITLFIPYVRSVFSVPMMVPRYFISVLPAILLIIAFGFEMIKSNTVKYFLIIFFCLLSFFDIACVKKYYSTIRKTQFRELASLIAKYKAFPVIAPITSWHQNYYLNKNGFKQQILGLAFKDHAQSVLQDSSSAVLGFWYADAHGGEQPTEAVMKEIAVQYRKVASVNLQDAWAMLFLNKKYEDTNFVYIDYATFDSTLAVYIDEDQLMPVWNNTPISKSVFFKKGQYEIYFTGKGTAVDKVFPHVNIAIDTNILTQFNALTNLNTHVAAFEIKNDINGALRIWMDNDSSNLEKNEDRNLFVKSVLILRKE